MNILEAALAYEKLGWFVLPLHEKEKIPAIKYAHRLDERPTPEEIKKWFKQFPNARVGIRTGKESGVDVLDFDGVDPKQQLIAQIDLPDTIMQKTGRDGGEQHFFQYHGGGKGLTSRANIAGIHGLDLRTDGGIVVLPPSPHPKSGNTYRWGRIDPTEYGLDDLLPMPPDMISFLRGKKTITHDPAIQQVTDFDWMERALEGTGEGNRHDLGIRLAGRWWTLFEITEKTTVKHVHDSVMLNMFQWNMKNQPPLSGKEVRRMVSDVAAYRKKERLLKVPIDKIEKHIYPASRKDPTYLLSLLSGDVIELTGEQLLKPDPFFNAVFKQTRTNQTLHNLGTIPTWRKYLSDNFTDSIITVIHEEATGKVGIIREALEVLAQKVEGPDRNPSADIQRFCVVQGNEISVKPSVLIKYLRNGEWNLADRETVTVLIESEMNFKLVKNCVFDGSPARRTVWAGQLKKLEG